MTALTPEQISVIAHAAGARAVTDVAATVLEDLRTAILQLDPNAPADADHAQTRAEHPDPLARMYAIVDAASTANRAAHSALITAIDAFVEELMPDA